MKLLFIFLGILLSIQQVAAFAPKEFSFDADVPPPLQELINKDLNISYELKGENASPLHQETFGKIDGTDYKNFFQSHIFEIGFSDCGDAGGAIACATGNAFFKKMWITNVYIKNWFNTAERIATLFHEARHTESEHSNWGHAKCPNELLIDHTGRRIGEYTLTGQEACDTSAQGSYGIEVTLGSNHAKKCTNCSEKFRIDSLLNAENMLIRIIDLDAREKLIKDSF